MCIIVDSTMYNDDGVRKCSHYNNNDNNNTTISNKNTNNISTTLERLKVGVWGGSGK